MKVSKVQWFHPNGEKMPNGVYFQRGGWLAECAANALRFKQGARTGLVVFPSGAKVEGAGRAFTGSFTSKSGRCYDSESPTMEFELATPRVLVKHAVELAEAWGQPEVLVRDGWYKAIFVVSLPGIKDNSPEEPLPAWNVRDLTKVAGAFNGVRWWARWAQKSFGKSAPSGALALPEGRETKADVRMAALKEAADKVAPAFGAKECRVGQTLDLTAAYRGVGSLSPVLAVEGVAPKKWVEFAKAVCAAAGEPRALVYPAGDEALWWMERCQTPSMVDDNNANGTSKVWEEEKKPGKIRNFDTNDAQHCEEWVRRAGKVVVTRIEVEDWFAPEGVFRWARLKANKAQGGGSGLEFALRWEVKGAGKAKAVVERALVVFGMKLDEVEELVASVPGAVCREVQVGREVKGDGSWLEEVFGERPERYASDEWELAGAGYVLPPSPSVFGRHDRYCPLRDRVEECEQEEPKGEEVREEPAAPAVEMKSAIRAVTLLQWMGPRAWANQAEEQRMPERIEKMLRDGHHAWFRVATGEGVPTSRCWMVFNEPGTWEYWQKYGVTRVLDVSEEGCRGYWSGNGRQWWKVEACAPRGKRVHVWNAKAAYRAVCGEMPWVVPFFDRSDRNRERLEKMYAYMTGVLGREGLDEAMVKRRLDTAATAQSGFSRWANRGLLYGGSFKWEKGEVW